MRIGVAQGGASPGLETWGLEPENEGSKANCGLLEPMVGCALSVMGNSRWVLWALRTQTEHG